MPVFARGDAAYLGVEMPSVPSGDAVFPVLGTRPTVGGPHADSTSVDATNATFTAEALVPNRLQASFFYRRTDAARFRGMSGSLRDALSEGLSEALDKEVIDQIVSDVARTAAAAVDTDATYRNRLVYSQIDGRFAQQESDLRMLVGSDTLADMAALFRGNNTEQSSVEVMRRLSGGIRVSPHIAATAANRSDSGGKSRRQAERGSGCTARKRDAGAARKSDPDSFRRRRRHGDGAPAGHCEARGQGGRGGAGAVLGRGADGPGRRAGGLAGAATRCGSSGCAGRAAAGR